jgi:hypothetical protein
MEIQVHRVNVDPREMMDNKDYRDPKEPWVIKVLEVLGERWVIKEIKEIQVTLVLLVQREILAI